MVESQFSDSNEEHVPIDSKLYKLHSSVSKCTTAMKTARQAIAQMIKILRNEEVIASQQCHTVIHAIGTVQEPIRELHEVLEKTADIPQVVVSSRLQVVIGLHNMGTQAEEVRQLLSSFRKHLVQPSSQREHGLRQPILLRLTDFQKQLQDLQHILKISFGKVTDLSPKQAQNLAEANRETISVDKSEKESLHVEKELTLPHMLLNEQDNMHQMSFSQQQGSSLSGENEMIKGSLFSHGYALVIGVGADLPITVKDAKAVGELLKDAQRCGYPLQQVRLLTEQQAIRTKIIEGLDWLAQKSQEDSESTVLVYFSGHGGDFPKYHLVPYDYDDNNISSTAISGEEFTEKLKAIQAEKLLVILDCCHAGGMASVKAPGFRSSPIPSELHTVLAQGSGRVVIASSRKDEKSFTGTPFSEFTRAFLEALAGYGAADQDGYAHIADIGVYVGRMVPNRTNDKQHPIFRMHKADDFVVSYYAGGKKSPMPLRGDLTYFPLHIQDNEIADRYWNLMKKLRLNILSIEEQMAEFIDQAAVPLDFIRAKSAALAKLAELEQEMQKHAHWLSHNLPPS